MIFAGELYDKSSAFEPLLSTAHHAHDLAGFLAVEVRVGKGCLFTPPLGRVRSASERVSLVRKYYKWNFGYPNVLV